MSAWICPDDMIDLITTAAGLRMAELGASPNQAALQAIFDDLRQTNYDSVNFRYSEHETPEPAQFRKVPELAALQIVHLLQIRQTLDSYGYQSCEHAGWATSDAYKLIVDIGEWANGKLTAAGWPRIPGDLPGSSKWLYEDQAAWEWERSKGFPELQEVGTHRLQALRTMYANLQP